MPLIVHRSSRPEVLAARLAEVLGEPPADALAIDRVAVHSGGLEQWLAMQVAAHNGVCSAVVFPHPNDLVAELAAEALGENPDALRSWTAGRLLWALLGAVPTVLDQPAVAPVRAYLDAEGASEHTLRLVILCQRLATVFQAYGTYRPDLVRRWQTECAGEDWEAPVWRAVEARLGATHLAAWAERLGDGPVLPPHAGRLALFSVSTLPPLLLEMVGRLAGARPVHVFVLHPSPAAWQHLDAQVGTLAGVAPGALLARLEEPGVRPSHPLLASMGTLARDFQLALARCRNVEHHLLSGSPPPRDSLLHALQADLHDDAQRAYAPAPGDRSLRLHTCASPLRQVQALRDDLLARLDDPTLQLRDIVVMSPDVETYAPLVEAVFGDGAERWSDAPTHPAGFPALPYRLADRGVRAQNPAAEALLRVLELLDGRLDAPEVVELFALEPVRERFGLDADALPRVRELLVEAGARWGRDAAHRVSLGLPDDDRFTWRFALDRLLLGQALAEPDGAELLGHAPGCGVEGRDDRAVLGGLADFAETLLEEAQALAGDRPPDAWLTRLAATVDRLTADGGPRGWQKRQVLDVLAELAGHAREAGIDTPVDLRTVRALLSHRFGAREPGQGFLGGAITVCELVPLRSIPFRVVCLLGIDDQLYPRIEARPGYDRMALERRPGDRDARADDRALFLEALLSARDAVVITCTGRSERSGRTQPLAVPVAELMETVAAMVPDAARAAVRIDHPLQPWSPALFVQGGSHDRRMAAAARSWRQGRRAPSAPERRFAAALPPCADAPTEMSLAELVRFWRHPPTQLVRRRLGLRLWQDDTELTATLPLALDGLERWTLDDTLLAAGRAGATLDAEGPLARRLLRGALLPMGAPGRVMLGEALERVTALLERAAPLLGAPAAPVDVDLPYPVRLSGRVDGLTAAGRVVLVAGRVHPRHQLDAWVHHLALHAAGDSARSYLLGPRGGVSFAPLPAAEAERHLRALCEAVGPSLDVPALFWADASHAALVAFEAEPDEARRAHRAAESARSVWRYQGDAEHLVDSWLLEGDNPFDPAMDLDALVPGALPPLDLARLVWGPALAARREEP